MLKNTFSSLSTQYRIFSKNYKAVTTIVEDDSDVSSGIAQSSFFSNGMAYGDVDNEW